MYAWADRTDALANPPAIVKGPTSTATGRFTSGSVRRVPREWQPVIAFTDDQVRRLTGVTTRRLDEWAERGLLRATIDRPVGSRRVRLFSFADMVAVRVAHWLRVVQRPDGSWEDWRNGQLVLDHTVPVDAVTAELARAVTAERAGRHVAGAVQRRRGVLGGAAVVSGTRVPVITLRSLHRAGWTAARIVESYPAVTVEDVEAAVNGGAA